MNREKLYIRLDRLNKFFLILIPFVISFSSAAVNTMFVLSLLTYLSKKVIKRQSIFIHTDINIPFALIIFVSFISFFNSINLAASLRGMWKLFKYLFMVFMIMDACRDKKFFKAVISSMMLGLFLASFDGIFQLIIGKDLFRGYDYIPNIGLRRITAAFPTANVFGIYLGLVVPIALSISLYFFRKARRILMLVFTAFAVLALIFTFSRGTGAGFLVAVIFMAMKKKDKFLGAVFCLAVILSVVFIPPQIKNWAANEESVWTILFNGDRLNMFKASLRMIKSHPLIGVGVNTYSLNYHIYKIEETRYFTGYSVYAHNHYLHMAGEIGILGLVSFLWLLVVLFRRWSLTYAVLQDRFVSAVSLGAAAALLAFLVNGISETALYYPKVAILFWFNVGLVLSTKTIADAEREYK